MDYEIIVVGASFAGLVFAHHLPRNKRVLLVDTKPDVGSSVESTGLITRATRKEFAEFFAIDAHLTNPIKSICVVAPGFEEHFISRVVEPWIFQTDTRGLVAGLAKTLPQNVDVQTGTTFVSSQKTEQGLKIQLRRNGDSFEHTTKLLVGADGGRSKVAEVSGLDRNKKFLFGYERVIPGAVKLGENPDETIYHFWFGEFSLGYGGWLSPTKLEGRPAFRVGLAKFMQDRGEASALTDKFLGSLAERGIVEYDPRDLRGSYMFGGLIPIGGALRRTVGERTMLIGDAAGYCGAFAADGIKGAVVSGKEGAKLATAFLDGDAQALRRLPRAMQRHGGLLEYYQRQLRYRFIWDLMRRDRTFRAMYDVIAAEKDSFLDQFCDNKDKRKSLLRIVRKPRHIGRLLKYAVFLVFDGLFHAR